jgi:hypothetical protein
MLEGEELEQVGEIVRWFAMQGIRVLVVHVAERNEWQAPMFATGRPPIGAEGLGRGPTALAAVEDLKARYEAGEIKHHVYVSDEEHGHEVARVEKREPSGAPVALPKESIAEPALSRASQHDIDFFVVSAFTQEPDGSWTGLQIDPERGEVMKSYVGDDYQDAVLGLFADIYPPSAEGCQ